MNENALPNAVTDLIERFDLETLHNGIFYLPVKSVFCSTFKLSLEYVATVICHLQKEKINAGTSTI